MGMFGGHGVATPYIRFSPGHKPGSPLVSYLAAKRRLALALGGTTWHLVAQERPLDIVGVAWRPQGALVLSSVRSATIRFSLRFFVLERLQPPRVRDLKPPVLRRQR